MHTGDLADSWLVRVSVIVTVSPLWVSLVSSVTWEKGEVKAQLILKCPERRHEFKAVAHMNNNGAGGDGVWNNLIPIRGSNYFKSLIKTFPQENPCVYI